MKDGEYVLGLLLMAVSVGIIITAALTPTNSDTLLFAIILFFAGWFTILAYGGD